MLYLTIMEVFIQKWLSNSLRDLNFINFTFEDCNLLNPPFLTLPHNGEEGIKNPDYDEINAEIIRKNYYNHCYNNIMIILNIIGINEDTKINVYANDIQLKQFLKNDNFVKYDNYYIKGECDYKNLINIIKCTILPDEYRKINPEAIYPTCKDTGTMDLYHFPDLKLFLYIYDERGGILVSENDNKEKLKHIFEKTEEIDSSLLNKSWYDDMKDKLGVH